MRRFLQVLLPVLVLGAGVLLMRTLIKGGKEAARHPVTERGALVEVRRIPPGTETAHVVGYGTLRAAREVTLIPQVSGRVTTLNPQLIVGGRLAADEVALKIERREYDARAAQARGQVEQAQLSLELETGRRTIASREWALMGEVAPKDAAGRDRALRKPQERNAAAQLTAARAGLELARINLARTSLRVPFNALVMEEAVEVGQVVGPQTRAARLVGTDLLWVILSLPVSELAWMDIPGAPATVSYDAGGAPRRRTGTVARVLGDLAAAGRMARVVVEVPKALDGPDALFLGAYVRVDITGKPVPQVSTLPRAALREGDRVWLLGEDDTLHIQAAQIIRRRPEAVLVRGLSADAQVITSRLSSPVQGMALRVLDAEAEIARAKVAP